MSGRDSPTRALLVVFAVALFCSILVSSVTVAVRPLKERNETVRRARHVVGLTGLVQAEEPLDNDRVLAVVDALDIRVVDIDAGRFDADRLPNTINSAGNGESAVSIAPALDLARLGSRPRHAIAYLAWEGDTLQRLILPIRGEGMWSTLSAFIALDADLTSIADVRFVEQAETAGLGDQIMRADWQAQWRGQRLFDADGSVAFRVAGGPARSGSMFEVDGLTGATITADAVTAMVRYWFGPHGYAPLLEHLKTDPPSAPGVRGR